MQTDYGEMSVGQAKKEATCDQPEWYEWCDLAREDIMDATHMLMDYPRVVKGGRLVSQAPRRNQARELLQGAIESLQRALEQV